jgi:hypothetical protein
MMMRVVVRRCVGEGSGISLEFFPAPRRAEKNIVPVMAGTMPSGGGINRHAADGIADCKGRCTISHSG